MKIDWSIAIHNIIEMKREKKTLKEICDVLFDTYGVKYTPGRISQVYRRLVLDTEAIKRDKELNDH